MKETMNVTRFTVTFSTCVLTVKTVGIATPANVKDLTWYRHAIENAELDALSDVVADRIETVNTQIMNVQASEKFDRDRVDTLESKRDTLSALWQNIEARKHDGVEYKHTIAHAVAYTLFGVMRGTKNSSVVPAGMYQGYTLARDLLKTGNLTDKSKGLQELANIVRDSMNKFIENDSTNADLTKKFTARVNLDMVRNLCYTIIGKYNYSKSGIKISVYDEREFCRQAFLMCLEKTFKFTDVVKVNVPTYSEI